MYPHSNNPDQYIEYFQHFSSLHLSLSKSIATLSDNHYSDLYHDRLGCAVLELP